MTYRWTEAHARDGNIPSAEDFERDYSAQKALVNGGLSRSNVGERAITRSHIAPNAFHQVKVVNDVILPSSLTVSNGGTGDFSCMNYEAYPGGWVSYPVSLAGLREGMLHVEWSCWCYHFSYETERNRQYTKWRILFDGLEVAAGNAWYAQWSNPILIADFPHPGGDHTLSLEWFYTPPMPGVDLITTNNLMYAGGSILCISRSR